MVGEFLAAPPQQQQSRVVGMSAHELRNVLRTEFGSVSIGPLATAPPDVSSVPPFRLPRQFAVLNEVQKAAVVADIENPLLVLAGTSSCLFLKTLWFIPTDHPFIAFGPLSDLRLLLCTPFVLLNPFHINQPTAYH